MKTIILRWIEHDGKSKLPLLDIFAASGLLTVFGTRAYLALMDYPQLGGETLHIAHMLWGGLLLAAVTLYLGLVDKPVRKAAMFFGGVGFGLFIDELGKFITVNNDYFFKPAASLIIAIFILIWVVLRVAIARHEKKPVLPAPQWPTRRIEKVYVYLWLVLQTVNVVALAVLVPFFFEGTVLETEYYLIALLYGLYTTSLLLAWVLIARHKKIAAAGLIRAIAATEILLLSPINFYISQFAAAAGFIGLVLLIVATSRDYEEL